MDLNTSQIKSFCKTLSKPIPMKRPLPLWCFIISAKFSAEGSLPQSVLTAYLLTA